jgi:phosphoglycerate dehydrogenase-like enzyme
MSSTTPAAPRCAVPDDYQGVAHTAADWSAAAVEVTVFREHLTGDALVAAVRECEVLVVMRERTPLTRAVLARLPRPRLVVTSGMRNAATDLDAAAERGVVVRGTASSPVPPTELTGR